MPNKNINKVNNRDSRTQGMFLAEMRTIERQSNFPPPVELREYENIYPGFTKSLMTQFEKQSEHRMGLENRVIDSGIKNMRRGQLYAFILSFLTISIGGALIFFNKDIIGIAAILGALGTLAAVFIYGNKSKREEREQKARINPDNLS